MKPNKVTNTETMQLLLNALQIPNSKLIIHKDIIELDMEFEDFIGYIISYMDEPMHTIYGETNEWNMIKQIILDNYKI